MQEWMKLLELEGERAVQAGNDLRFGDAIIPIRDGIPRFTPDVSYSTGNFSVLRERHAQLQLDSQNGTNDRYRTILTRTGWTPEFFKDKLILECGCGAGPDTEILLALGARVLAVDIAGLDIARRNLSKTANVQLLQASISDLPVRKHAFDIVFCHRVIQHTPDPVHTLSHILQFVKPDGAVFVHSYAASFKQRFRWKYWLRPITTRMDPEQLYNAIRASARPLYQLTNVTNRSRAGRRLTHILIPFLNYRSKFPQADDEFIIEYGIHDTFDALSPRYDRPLKVAEMEAIASRTLSGPFEVVTTPSITLLRSIVRGA